MGAIPVPCDCAENARVLTVPAEVMPHKVAACVLQDRPTRGILHAGLGSCLGRSTWQPPPQGAAPARPAGRWDEERGQPPWGEGAGTWQPDAQADRDVPSWSVQAEEDEGVPREPRPGDVVQGGLWDADEEDADAEVGADAELEQLRDSARRVARAIVDGDYGRKLPSGEQGSPEGAASALPASPVPQPSPAAVPSTLPLPSAAPSEAATGPASIA